jgi:hypothetical protein
MLGLRQELQFGMAADGRGHRARQRHVVCNHGAIPGGADVPERQPDLQRAEAPRVATG